MTRADRIRTLNNSPGLWRKVYRIGQRRAFVYAGYDIQSDTFGMRALCGRIDLVLLRQRSVKKGARVILAAIRRLVRARR